jgi:hypothetical protein
LGRVVPFEVVAPKSMEAVSGDKASLMARMFVPGLAATSASIPFNH